MENNLILIVVAAIVLLAAGIALVVIVRGKKRPPLAPPAPSTPEVAKSEKVEEAPVAPTPPPTPAPIPSAPQPLSLPQRLGRTKGIFGKLEKFWGRGSQAALLSSKEWEELEETLLEADVGVPTTTLLLQRVKDRLQNANAHDLKPLLQEEAKKLFLSPNTADSSEKPYVISIVGINGVGKTTTIGKLAHRFMSEGKSVLMGGADTFRAGAIAQLKIWSERVGAQFVGGREGGDPGAVAFDALAAAKARGLDIVLVDTAGRLHTKTNLMEELKKVHRVMKKVIPSAPHEIWLVLDGTLGQNSLRQAKEFAKALELTGVIMTKLDGTAKGGALFAVSSELNLPVRFIGLGEGVEDLIPFNSGSFVDAIL